MWDFIIPNTEGSFDGVTKGQFLIDDECGEYMTWEIRSNVFSLLDYWGHHAFLSEFGAEDAVEQTSIHYQDYKPGLEPPFNL